MHKERKFEGSFEVTYILRGAIAGHGRTKTSYPTLQTRHKRRAIYTIRWQKYFKLV